MFKSLSSLLFFFITFQSVSCFKEDNGLSVKDPIQWEQDRPLKYVFLFGAILTVTIIRFLVKSHNIPIPYAIFTMLSGVLWGVGTWYNDYMHRMAEVAETAILNIELIYLPFMLFNIAFRLDVHAFLKALPQILLVAGPACLLSTAMCGLLMRMVIEPDWLSVDGIIFGTINAAVYPLDIYRCLKESNVQTKYITVLLQGETLFSSVIAINVFSFLIMYITGWVIWWYQFILGILRMVFVAVPMGYLFGWLGIFLMRFSYSDVSGLMLLTVTMAYTTFYFTRWLCAGGSIATVIAGIMMGKERTALSKDSEEAVLNFWKMITIIINGVIFITAGVATPIYLGSDIYFKDYIVVVVTYLVINMARFVAFFLFSPFLSRLGYGMSFQNMIICVWGGLKNPINLNMALHLKLIYKDEMTYKWQLFFLHTVGVYMLMLLINGTFAPVILKTLGMSELSLSRQLNMNNCMKFIYEARARTIAILKMDRFLSDANWPLVISLTSLKHPYKKVNQLVKEEDESEEDEDDFMGNRFTFCPDCEKKIPNEPTSKELKEMSKEAKFRILKLKKTAYSRLFENGMISKVSIRILHQAVEIAMESEEGIIELDGLYKLFSKESIFYKFLRTHFQTIMKSRDEDFKPPKRRCRLWCYNLVRSIKFTLIMNVIVVTNMFFISIWFKEQPKKYGIFHCFIIVVYFIFFVVYLIELVINVLALSWIRIWEHGIKGYFESFWNVLEFIILCYCLAILIVRGVVLAFINIPRLYYMELTMNILLAIRTLRLLKYLNICKCCDALPPAVLKFLDSKVERHRALAFELGKSYVAGDEEILDNIQQIVDNNKIREAIRKKMDSDRLTVTRSLGIVQKKWPWIASSAKTKTAMNTVLNSMREDIYELKVSGWVDDVEYEKLLKSLAERYKCINSIRIVPPSPPKLIFQELSYMNREDEELNNFLYSNICTKKFDPGDIVVNDNELIDGIYILITGLFLISYNPKKSATEKLKDMGALPVIDCIGTLKYDEPVSEYILPGSTLGELSTLTDRPYDAIVISETHSEIYIIKREIVKKALEMDPDPVDGIGCRIWRSIAFRKAVTILTNVPSHRSYTQEQLKYIVERSFVPNLSNYKVFTVTEMMEDVLLIEGIAIDFNTRDIYVGPNYIPRACQRLLLPKSSTVQIDTTVETKLLVIPAKDFDEYEIMVSEEQICELVNTDSTKCLKHLIQTKSSVGSKSSKTSRQSRGLMGVTKKMRKQLLGVESTKSRIGYASSRTSKVSKRSRVTLRETSAHK